MFTSVQRSAHLLGAIATPAHAVLAANAAAAAAPAAAAVQESLLMNTDYVVQQWQGRCQELRAQHEAALTDGISSQPHAAPPTQG
jgi:hypothetical protein